MLFRFRDAQNHFVLGRFTLCHRHFDGRRRRLFHKRFCGNRFGRFCNRLDGLWCDDCYRRFFLRLLPFANAKARQNGFDAWRRLARLRRDCGHNQRGGHQGDVDITAFPEGGIGQIGKRGNRCLRCGCSRRRSRSGLTRLIVHGRGNRSRSRWNDRRYRGDRRADHVLRHGFLKSGYSHGLSLRSLLYIHGRDRRLGAGVLFIDVRQNFTTAAHQFHFGGAGETDIFTQ